MSDLQIDLDGKLLHFDIVLDGWLGGEISETLLHVEMPVPDYSGRKPSFIYRPRSELSKREWIKIDEKLMVHFITCGYPDAMFGFGTVVSKTEKSITMHNGKTRKTVEMFFEGDTIVEVNILRSK